MKTIWKVLIGIGVFLLLIVILAFCGSKGVGDAAKTTLKAIQSGDYAKAYSLTSSEFQQTMSLDQFKAFIAQYPILKDYKKISIDTQEVNNDTGKITGNLTDAWGIQTPIEMGFVKENKEWKLWNTIVGTVTNTSESSPTPASTSDSSSIYNVLVSDTADGDGYVSAAKSVLSKSAAHIFATAQISDAIKGTVATGYLVFDGSGDKIGPIDNPIEQTGNVLKAFSFTNTAGEWPVGDYTINIKISNGQTKGVKFKVE